ncbi:MAG: polyphosphate kinase 2 family protein, partial [Acidimicrobiia bacterium]|nr:polyphosphate kinase 2 family protein [Acidimicrobiia bacterium]
HWDAYTVAYQEAIAETATEHAPWWIVPSDRKWYRNLVVSQILIESLERLDLRYPEPAIGIENIVITD